MGHARWDPADWTAYAGRTAGRSREELFDRRTLAPELDPRGVAWREARDSDSNPESTAIIVALDVTGSMGMLAEALARRGLGTLVEEVLRRRPVPDPQVMAMGVGDAAYDQAPLQVTQFEADIRIAEQLKTLWLEHGGGGNDSESYHLPWYFAARHVAMDCWDKRNRKGYLFTVGDEMPPPPLTPKQLQHATGDRGQCALSAAALLREAERRFHVFHLVAEEGSFARRDPDAVRAAWGKLLGQRCLALRDHTRMAEVIVSAIAVTEGADAEQVAESWDGSAALTVRRALLPTAPRRGLFRFGGRA